MLGTGSNIMIRPVNLLYDQKFLYIIVIVTLKHFSLMHIASTSKLKVEIFPEMFALVI